MRLTKLIPAMSAFRPSAPAASARRRDARRRDLRRRILAGELAPGERLKLDELAALCEVSHMPVREALREFEGEGVLEGFRTAAPSSRASTTVFLRNLYDVRAAIEGMLTGTLRGAHRRRRRRPARGRWSPPFEAAARMHDALVQIGGNRELHDTINQAADNPEALGCSGGRACWPMRCACASATAPAASTEIVTEHRAIC